MYWVYQSTRENWAPVQSFNTSADAWAYVEQREQQALALGEHAPSFKVMYGADVVERGEG